MTDIHGRFYFPRTRCPCGSPQLDPDRLYCYTCLNAMSIRMAEELSEQRGGGIRGYLEPSNFPETGVVV